MTPDEIRNWIDDQRAAAARIAADAREHRLTSAEAFRAALDLLVFDEAVNGDPFNRADVVSDREDEEARAAWDTLRARWPRER